jgi:hypothetical protein
MEDESVTIYARVFTDKHTVDKHIGELRGVIPFLEKQVTVRGAHPT